MFASTMPLPANEIQAEVKLIALDWDLTLYNPFTFTLYENVDQLILDLQKQGVPIYIVTANPDRNVQMQIKKTLDQNAIAFNPNNIYWSGRTQYIDHETGGQDKLATLSLIARKEKVELSQILFVDDRVEYINIAKKNSVQTLLVDSKCARQDDYLQAVNARNNFYKSVIQYIKDRKVERARLSLEVASKNKKKNNNFFRVAAVVTFLVAAAVIGALVVAALYFGAIAAVAIGVSALLIFTTAMIFSECRFRSFKSDQEARKYQQVLNDILSEQPLSQPSDVPPVYDPQHRLGNTSSIQSRFRGNSQRTVYEPCEDIDEGSSSIDEYTETDFADVSPKLKPVGGDIELDDVDKYSEGSFRVVTGGPS